MLISLTNIQRLFRTDEVETSALHDIDLTVDRGDFISIMGPSGCGKSTLLNILGTIDKPTSGSYHFGGVKLTGLGEKALAEFRRSHLGFIFQNFNLLDELTVEENIELALSYRGVPKAERRTQVAEAMERVEISHRARHYPAMLSGGQQQRAAIARAIVSGPAVLLADEPTGNLDTSNGAQVMDILCALNMGGTTIVMVTHSPAHAEVAKRQIGMLDGRVIPAERSLA